MRGGPRAFSVNRVNSPVESPGSPTSLFIFGLFSGRDMLASQRGAPGARDAADSGADGFRRTLPLRAPGTRVAWSRMCALVPAPLRGLEPPRSLAFPSSSTSSPTGRAASWGSPDPPCLSEDGIRSKARVDSLRRCCVPTCELAPSPLSEALVPRGWVRLLRCLVTAPLRLVGGSLSPGELWSPALPGLRGRDPRCRRHSMCEGPGPGRRAVSEDRKAERGGGSVA